MALFLIRYGEIALKSAPVRRKMEKILMHNIRTAFAKEKTPCSIKKSFGRIFLETHQPQKAKKVLKRVFGIVSFSPCFSCTSGMEEIKALALKRARTKKFTTFAIKTHRLGVHDFTSQDINIQVGDVIRTTLKKRVDLTHPQKTFFIEIRDKITYLYTEKIPCLGGMPLGSTGIIVTLLESREDLLAAWLFMRRGCVILPVTDKKSFVKTLEKWSFREIESYKKTELEKILERYPFGIVTADQKKIKKLKKQLSLPVFNPLLGMEEKEVKRMLKAIRK